MLEDLDAIATYYMSSYILYVMLEAGLLTSVTAQSQNSWMLQNQGHM